jgi:hypothetical protein
LDTFHFFLKLNSSVVISAGLVLVKRDVVDGADTKAASHTSEDVSFDSFVMNLSRRATLCHAVAEVWVNAQEVANREVVEPVNELISD